MAWEFTDDVTVYLERVWPLLVAHPVDNTLALTVVEAARAGQRWSDEPMLFGWYQQGSQVSGAVLQTPPYELVLAVVPDGAVDDLVITLHARQVWVPGVYGDPDLVECFAKRWIAGTSWRAVVSMHQRLYALGTLHPPASPPAGGAQRAGREDFDLALGWFVEFAREIGARAAGLERTVGRRIDHGLVWLWHDPAGVVVSLAGRNPTLGGVARLGPVYTPPQHRRRGYGAAVTAACTRDALCGGAQHVVLFTELANPTSNALYQRLGYRPVSDRTITTFMH